MTKQIIRSDKPIFKCPDCGQGCYMAYKENDASIAICKECINIKIEKRKKLKQERLKKQKPIIITIVCLFMLVTISPVFFYYSWNMDEIGFFFLLGLAFAVIGTYGSESFGAVLMNIPIAVSLVFSVVGCWILFSITMGSQDIRL